MSQTCKNCVGPTCKALGLPAAVPWLWQVTSELQLWWRSNYGMKMQQSQPHGLREPLAKKKLLHCGSAPFFSHTCWKLEALLWNEKMQSIIAICRVRTGNDWASNPKHTKQHSFQIFQRHQNSRSIKTPDTPDCWLLLVVCLSLWKGFQRLNQMQKQ